MITAIVQARMGSTRLPGKVLMELCTRPLLGHVVERLHHSKRLERIVVATSASPLDDRVESFCRQEGILCYRGREDDVLDRYFMAAKSYAADPVVRVTADCPLIDPVVLDETIDAFLREKCDYASNTIDRTYPDGLDVEVFSNKALEKAWHGARMASEREHVTPYIWKRPDQFRIYQVKAKRNLSSLRWTVDEPEDMDFAKKVYSRLYRPEDSHLCRPGKIFLMDDVLRLLEENPEIQQINQGFETNEGYIRSLEKDHIVPRPESRTGDVSDDGR